MRTEMMKMKTRLDQLESVVQPLLSLSPLLAEQSPCFSDTSALLKVASFVESIASEVKERLICARQVIAFNVPDKLPAEKAKEIILQAGGLEDRPAKCIRLRKASPLMCCPLRLEFQDEESPKALIKQQRTISRQTSFKNIRLVPAYTSLQREMMKKRLPLSETNITNKPQMPPPPTNIAANKTSGPRMQQINRELPDHVGHPDSRCYQSNDLRTIPSSDPSDTQITTDPNPPSVNNATDDTQPTEVGLVVEASQNIAQSVTTPTSSMGLSTGRPTNRPNNNMKLKRTSPLSQTRSARPGILGKPPLLGPKNQALRLPEVNTAIP